MAVLADDDVIVHGDTERRGDIDDRLGHLDIGLRGRRIAGGMVVHQQTTSCINVENNWGMGQRQISHAIVTNLAGTRSLCRQSTIPSNHGIRIDINPRGSKVHGTHDKD